MLSSLLSINYTNTAEISSMTTSQQSISSSDLSYGAEEQVLSLTY